MAEISACQIPSTELCLPGQTHVLLACIDQGTVLEQARGSGKHSGFTQVWYWLCTVLQPPAHSPAAAMAEYSTLAAQ